MLGNIMRYEVPATAVMNLLGCGINTSLTQGLFRSPHQWQDLGKGAVAQAAQGQPKRCAWRLAGCGCGGPRSGLIIASTSTKHGQQQQQQQR